MKDDLESRTIRRCWPRIVPLMGLALLCAYLDRINLGFAALQMNGDLGLSNTVFGLGAGFYAVGSGVFVIPSTLILHRVGARGWIAFMALAWAAASAATALVTNAQELLLVRFLIGATEAGFSPGAILYFSTWFPANYRGRVLGWFLLISPLGFMLGGPMSSLLLSYDGALGLRGWQWIFIVEAIPSVLLAAAVFAFLPDTPERAKWLEADQRTWLIERLAADRARADAASPGRGAWSGLQDLRLWMLALFMLCLTTMGIAVTFFLPLLARAAGFSTTDVGFVVAFAALGAGLMLPVWGWLADRAASPARIVAAATATMMVGLLAAGLLGASPWTIAAIAVAMAGFNGAIASFWTLPPRFLTGAAAASGIAFINMAGTVGTFAGPALQGWATDRTGSYSAGLLGLAGVALVALAILGFAAAQLRVERRKQDDIAAVA